MILNIIKINCKFEKLETGVGSQARTCFEVFFIIWTRQDQLRRIWYGAHVRQEIRNISLKKIILNQEGKIELLTNNKVRKERENNIHLIFTKIKKFRTYVLRTYGEN